MPSVLPVLTSAVPDVIPAAIVLMFYPSALIFAVNTCNSTSSSSLVGAGGAVGGTYAASSASLAASSSAVNGIGPSAVMWCLDIIFPYELARP